MPFLTIKCENPQFLPLFLINKYKFIGLYLFIILYYPHILFNLSFSIIYDSRYVQWICCNNSNTHFIAPVTAPSADMCPSKACCLWQDVANKYLRPMHANSYSDFCKFQKSWYSPDNLGKFGTKANYSAAYLPQPSESLIIVHLKYEPSPSMTSVHTRKQLISHWPTNQLFISAD